LKETFEELPYLNPSSAHRTQRGLLDGVRQIDKYLFGIVITADVDSLQTSEMEMAERIKSLQETLVHEHNSLEFKFSTLFTQQRR